MTLMKPHSESATTANRAPETRAAEVERGGASQGWFATTRWSAVVNAGRDGSPTASSALAQLCETYWRPLFLYVRHRGLSAQDAEDAVQGFFADLLRRNAVARADRDRGRFRSFLLASMNHFLSHERDRNRALKRGGGMIHTSIDHDATGGELAATESPERHYDRAWALSVLERAARRFEHLKDREYSEPVWALIQAKVLNAHDAPAYAALANASGLSEATLRCRIHRMRKQYYQCIRLEVADTVGTFSDIDAELRYLLSVVAP